MTAALYTYHPSPFGVCLERLDCAADPVVEGRRLAAVMRSKPEGQRAVLCNDLGGGRSPDDRHWFTRADGKPLTREQAEQVYRNGAREGSAHANLDWMVGCRNAYVGADGLTLDFLAANVEAYPGAFLPNEATFDECCAWSEIPADRTKQQRTDGLQYGGSHKNCLVVTDTIRHFPAASIRCNLGAVNGTIRDQNGQIVGPTFGYAAPFLYLTSTARNTAVTPDSVLAANICAWDACAPGKVAVVAPVTWGGEGDKPSVPGCTVKWFTFPDGTRKRFYIKPFDTWASRWEKLVRTVAADADAIVVWWNKPPFGPEPSKAELTFMGQVLRSLG